MPTFPASDFQPAPPLTCDAPPTRKPRGNPNLNLAPRCGARTRVGCPCQAPAIHGKQRCRMHGGRSTGPRTPEGLARLRAAHTVHGRYGAEARTRDRHLRSIFRRGQVYRAALRYVDRLPSELAARLNPSPPELDFPPYPKAALSAAQHRAMQRAEAEALAPWKQAIAAIRAADRGMRAAAKAHAPDRIAATGARQQAATEPRTQILLVPSESTADPHGCVREPRSTEQNPMHQYAGAAAATGPDPTPAPRAPEPRFKLPCSSTPVPVPVHAWPAAQRSATPHAPDRPPPRPGAVTLPASALLSRSAAEPHAPVAPLPVLCRAIPPGAAAPVRPASTRQHLMAGASVATIALFQFIAGPAGTIATPRPEPAPYRDTSGAGRAPHRPAS